MARPEDVAWLAGTLDEIYRSEFHPLLPDVDWRVYDEAYFTARFSRDLARVRVAWRGAVPLGFSMITGTHLDMLFVAAGQRGAGVGVGLMAGAATLECFAANVAARRFYERHGWRLEREYRRAFGGRDCDFVAYVRD